MNQERPNEERAKETVERELRLRLNHHDTHGGVDYLSLDGEIALEVTAVTDGEKTGAWKALKKSVAKGAPNSPLKSCWLIFVPDDQADMKTFVQRVQPAIVELELAAESYFDARRAAIHAIQGGPLAAVYRPLLEAGIDRASAAPHEGPADDPDHQHRLLVSPGSGGSASGSDEAVDLLLHELLPKTDNLRKLRESGSRERHLFVWVNDNTSFGIERPLSHEPLAGAEESWGLPSKAPVLDPAITHFWVVHERSGSGWLWDGETWQELQKPES